MSIEHPFGGLRDDSLPKSVLRRLLLLGALLMSQAFADEPRAAPAMRGPDFSLNAVRSWKEVPGHGAELVLDDGSRWLLESERRDYEVQKAFVVRAANKGGYLLVSGDRARGIVDRLSTARALAAQRVEDAGNGCHSVLFVGPPSIYHLRPDRPEASQTLELLERSAARGLPMDKPDLLVGIDVVSSEVVLAKALGQTVPQSKR